MPTTGWSGLGRARLDLLPRRELLAYGQAVGGFLRRPRRSRNSAIATINLLGSVAFGVAAIAAYWVPTSGASSTWPRPTPSRRSEACASSRALILLLPRRGSRG